MPCFPRFVRLASSVVLGSFLVAACAPPDVPAFSYGEDNATGKRKPSKKTPGTSTDAGATSTTGGDAPPPSTVPAAEAPTLSSITPDAITLGAAPAGLDLTLSGTRFAPGCTVDLAGTRLEASLTSPNELKVRVPAALLATARALRLTGVSQVLGESNALSFTVANPTSVSIATLAPSTALVGASSVALTVTGSGFIATSTVRFNGASLPTTLRSPTELGATIPNSALLDAGRFSVTVTSGADVVSLPSQFEVANGTPQATTLTPKTVEAGSAAIAVTVDGEGFTRSSELLAGQTPLATTFVSAQRLRATLPASLLATAGSLAIRAQSPTPGGGASGQLTFTITAAQQQAAACTYTCAEYNYAAGECYEGFACNGATGCLYERDCNAGAAAATCVYRCADYGYAPGQCSGGWLCLSSGEYAGCLGQTTCN